MGRAWRIEYKGALYHILSRGNEKGDIFYDNSDRGRFLDTIAELSDRFAVDIFAYVLMDNHYHLLMETAFPNLGKVLQRLNSAYTTYLSRKRQKSGHLLQGRPKVLLIDKDSYALELSRYIHLNPVKARMVEFPEAYGWSSYVYYHKRISRPSHMETSFLLGQLGSQERVARREMKKYVEAGRTGHLPDPLKDVRGGAILGDASFVQWVQKKFLKRRNKDRDLPGLKELKRLDLSTIRDLVEKKLKSDPRLARKAAIYLCRKYSERSLGELGGYFGGMSVSAVNQVVRRFEKQRSADRFMDRQIRALEKEIQEKCNV